MRLFIAEKPSLARAIADGIGKGSKADGHIIIGKDVVTWCFGHILEQYAPDEYDEKYRQWNMDTLPIIPSEWKLKVKKDAAKQYKHIKELVEEADEIVNAGDPDREGQLLVDEVLEQLKNKKPVKRILLNALDLKSVQQALQNLRDNKEFIGMRDSARARSEADWLVGMNLTRAYTLRARDAGYSSVLSIGRVQTPTMALVVRRENEIQNFKATKHFGLEVFWDIHNTTVQTEWMPSSGLDNEKRLLDKSLAETCADKIQKQGVGQVDSFSKEAKKEAPRFPYSLSTLQVDAGKKYGYSPKQVLDAMQELYEAKLTTYPRSDCEYLPTNQLSDAGTILLNLSSTSDLSKYVQQANTKNVSRCWDDKKISAHHALIPTTKKADFSSLSDVQAKLYLLVSKAYIAQFMPEHAYEQIKFSISCAGEMFKGSGKVVKVLGWRALYSGDEKDEGQALPEMKKGEEAKLSKAQIAEKLTKPPKRYTEATLLQAMKEIHRYVQDKSLAARLKESKGIGSEATRAPIIERLKTVGFLRLEKKMLVPTEKAIAAVKALPDSLTYPDTTAVWELKLDEVETGKRDMQAFVKEQEKVIRQMVEEAKGQVIDTAKDVPLCPNCGKPLRLRKGKNGAFWGCSGYPNCKTTFPDKGGKPDLQAKKGNASKTGKEAECPVCHKKLRQISWKGQVFWGCEDRNCGASFSDCNGEPYIEKCPNCGEGYLKRFESKKKAGTYFWACTKRCGAFFDDAGGKGKPKVRSAKNGESGKGYPR